LTECTVNQPERYKGTGFVRDDQMPRSGKKPVAEPRPIPPGRKLGDLPEIFASLPRLGDEEAAAFGADIDAARKELGPTPDYDPWES